MTDVFCHGRWLMRDRNLLTLDEAALIREAEAYARRVDAFLLAREENVLSKLLAIGGLRQSESFEVQVKARLDDEARIQRLLEHPDVEILKQIHYRQYDTYFLFDDAEHSRLRYREDDLLDADGDVASVRARLTFTAPTRRQQLELDTLLSKSRFIADADRPLRFYREYFRATSERELQKDRRRWHILYQGVLFYVNVDRVIQPQLDGTFFEIKSRTWSLSDANEKSSRIQRMLEILGLGPDDVIQADYLDIQPAGL